jgi:hypothetical protein
MTLTRVNTNGITDGTIVNTDVSASAAIDKTKISGTAITAADTGTVTSALIADANVTEAKVANSAITTAKIADANVTSGKLASGAAVANIGYTPVNKAGDTMTGAFNVQGPINSQGPNAAFFFQSRTQAPKEFAWYSQGSAAILYSNQGVGDLLEVDHSGRLRLPNQPAFLASITINATASSVGNQSPVPFSNVVLNQGGHYNASTYRFTAPVGGVYFLSWYIRINNANNYLHHFLARNGSAAIATNTQGQAITTPLGTTLYASIQRSQVLYLSAGDYVEVRQGDSSFSSGTYETQQSIFSGFLLG